MYNFWELLPGVLIVLIVGGGLFAAVMVQIVAGVAAILINMFGMKRDTGPKYSRVRVYEYDEDEDR